MNTHKFNTAPHINLEMFHTGNMYYLMLLKQCAHKYYIEYIIWKIYYVVYVPILKNCMYTY